MGIIDKYFIKKPLFRKFLTSLFYGDKDKMVQFFNTCLYINSIKENGYLRASHYALKSSVFKDEVSILINLASFISPDTSFVDVGANVGLYSSTFNRFQKLYPGLKIYAFEANPDTYARLKETSKGTNIQVYNNAISNNDGELEFVQGVVSHVFAEKTYANKYHLKKTGTVKIQAKRLDSFIFVGNRLIIKIDVEGHEFEVLEGAKELFDAGRVKIVYIDGCQKKEQILTFLSGYSFKFLDGKTLNVFQLHDFSLLAVNDNLS